MIIRAIDEEGNWLYGRGKNDYLKNGNAIAELLSTRLKSFLGDCFFDNTSGIDWFNLLGAKDERAISLAVSATILNTEGVTALLDLSINLSQTRVITITCSVNTVYGRQSNLIVENNVG